MNFRKKLICIGLLFFVACTNRNAPAAESTATSHKDTTGITTSDSSIQDTSLQNIAGIQWAYEATMNKLKTGAFDSSSFAWSCNNGEKEGTVRYFSEAGKLRMIVHRYNEYDHHSAEDHYFVKDSALFFVWYKKVSWSFEDGAEGATRDAITEQRIYLVNGKPVKCLEKSFVVRSHVPNNQSSETVPSKEVDCTILKSVVKPFQLLSKHRNNAHDRCLEY